VKEGGEKKVNWSSTIVLPRTHATPIKEDSETLPTPPRKAMFSGGVTPHMPIIFF
jgi:hypothetical protein